MSFQEYLLSQSQLMSSQKQLGTVVQARPVIRGLALEGGGVCGIGHIGVIRYLNETDQLAGITHFAGTSAGAIVAGLLACRMPYETLLEVMMSLDFNSFEDSKWFILSDIYRVWSEFGLNSGKNIALVYSQIITNYLGSPDITLGQIKDKFGTTLIIPTTSWKTGQTIYLNTYDNPDTTLVEAVQQSASYPIEMTPFACPSSSDIRLDGGLLDNYPIRALRQYLSEEEIIGSKLVPSSSTNTFLNLNPLPADACLKSPQTVNSSENSSSEDVYPDQIPSELKSYPLPTNLTTFLKGLVRIYRDLSLRVHVHPDDWARSIRVNIGTISSFDLDLSEADKANLSEQGYLAAKKFFDLDSVDLAY